MKKNMLRMPLIYTAIVLIFLIAMLCIGISDPEATVLSSISLILMAAFRSMQWFVAMTLALAFCTIFLLVVFFGAASLFNWADASRMYSELRCTLMSWLQPAQELLRNWRQAVRSRQQQFFGISPAKQELKEEFDAEIEMIRSQLHTTKEILTIKIERLSARIDMLEEIAVKMPDKRQVEVLSSEVRAAVASLAGIEEAVGTMKNCVEQTAGQLLELSSEKILGDFPERLRTLEQRQTSLIDIRPLEDNIACIQEELAMVREKADKALLTAAPNTQHEEAALAKKCSESVGEEHRLLGYFDNPADKQKITELVDAALEKNMNSKQVIDFVIKGISLQQGKIISSHPSLIKDYIRECRRND